jgi:hypothetical protein
MELFKNRRLIIATKHKKEEVISPILEKALGVRCFNDSTFDTDTFGTFSGEIERLKDPVQTIREKCLAAMEKNDCDLAVASEGSFGPHPSLYFANADDELVMLVDRKNNIEIVSREISLETNFNARSVKTKTELLEFVKSVQFPSHAVILKKAVNDHSFIKKGIQNEADLIEYFNYSIKNFGSAYIETDMRAMFNPTRMKIIEVAAQKLVENIQKICPHCQTPGFSVKESIPGLPCEWCNYPTNSVLCHKAVCSSCGFEELTKFPYQKEFEDPTYCAHCNP